MSTLIVLLIPVVLALTVVFTLFISKLTAAGAFMLLFGAGYVWWGYNGIPTIDPAGTFTSTDLVKVWTGAALVVIGFAVWLIGWVRSDKGR